MKKNIYLERYGYPQTFIKSAPSDNLNLIITIPCYNESNLIQSLLSIYNCQLPGCSVEVIVVINNAEDASSEIQDQNKSTFIESSNWAKTHNSEALQFYIIYVDNLPKKHAGVGLARKIAMDEAVKRFESIEKSNGIISCFDADSECSPNYLTEIVNHFDRHPKINGCSIYFEHPFTGVLSSDHYNAIIEYELFLRYYTHALKYVGVPYAYHTVGSSMAVRSDAYQKQGGMNKRKAGEDFYFLHKIIALGNFTELKTTKVIPSPRQSDRVPFGTGKAVKDWMISKSLDTYNPKSFIALKQFIDQIDDLYKYHKTIENYLNDLDPSIVSFLTNSDFEKVATEMNNKSTTIETFKNHFFQWFNAFKVLKYLHYSRDHYYANVPIQEAATWLLNSSFNLTTDNVLSSLNELRKIDLEI